MSYILVNPKLNYKSVNSSKKKDNEAADDIWSQLSSNIKSYTPTFYFSIQNTNDSKLSHYSVTESLESGRVKYVLKKYKNKNINEKILLEDKNQQKGGKKKHKHKYDDSSSSSSSSSSSEEKFLFTLPKKNHNEPLILSYNPLMYGISAVTMPMVSSVLASQVYLWW